MLSKIRDIIIVFGLGLLVGYASFLNYSEVKEEPYSSSSVDDITWVSDDEVIVTVTFFKNANSCTWSSLRLVGYTYEGAFKELTDFEDVDGERGDRIAGWHTIRLKIKGVEGIVFIEGFTRHFCSDLKRDKILFQKNLEVPNAP